MTNFSPSLLPFVHGCGGRSAPHESVGVLSGRRFFFVLNYQASQVVMIPLEEWHTDALTFEFSGRSGSGFSPISAGDLRLVLLSLRKSRGTSLLPISVTTSERFTSSNTTSIEVIVF